LRRRNAPRWQPKHDQEINPLVSHELQIHGLYDLEGEETDNPAEARRILVRRPDGKFVVIEVGARALVSRFTSN
jgi:hypothetical protein